ncbi:circadian clock KaiB family protein [Nocardioides sp.]|uniref:circadian clock KaiB family protein n=1 Tax=Nocardioides sp. TaxID=35761 RepID=UPI0035625720
MKHFVIRLYVAGGTQAARQAEASLRQLMSAAEVSLDLEVIDVLAHPTAAEAAGVLSTPLLVREEPGPRRRIIGDLTDCARLADALGVNYARTAMVETPER